MASLYRFPCSQCAAIREISISQAGERLTCSACGHVDEVPNLSGIRQLEQVEGSQTSSKPKKNWSHAQGMMFSGGLLGLLIGGALTAFFLTVALRMDTQAEELQEIEDGFDRVDEMSLSETYEMWTDFADNKPIGEWRESAWEEARRWQTALLILSVPSGLITLAGAVSLALSFRQKAATLSKG